MVFAWVVDVARVIMACWSDRRKPRVVKIVGEARRYIYSGRSKIKFDLRPSKRFDTCV